MKEHRFFILSGPVRGGKTTFIQGLCQELQAQRLRINGILSLAHFIGVRHEGYNGMDLQTGEVFRLARLKGNPDWERIGQYFFDPEGMNKAAKSIREFQDSDLTVIDEIGHLELQEKGFWPAFQTLRKRNQPTLIAVREGLVEPLLQKISEKAVVFHLNEDNLLKKMSEALISPQK